MDINKDEIMMITYNAMFDEMASISRKHTEKSNCELKIHQTITTLEPRYLLLKQLIETDYVQNIHAINAWMTVVADLGKKYETLKNLYANEPDKQHIVAKAQFDAKIVSNVFNTMYMDKLFILQSLGASIEEDRIEVHDYLENITKTHDLCNDD